MKKNKYLITGCAGFIGSHILRRLITEDYDVVGIDDLSTGRRENIEGLEKDFKFVEGSVCDMDLVKNLCDGVDCILHQASIPSVPRSLKNPLDSVQASIVGTVTLLQAACEAGVRRLVQAGSSSAYGNTEQLPKVETMLPRPMSPYAVAKLTQEYYAAAFSSCWDIETVTLRYFNVFGPRQDPNSEYAAVIPKFITRMLGGEAPVIYGDGTQSRDFTYIDNVVEGNLCAARAKGPFSGEVINLACGNRVSLLELVDCLNQLLGIDLKPIHDTSRSGDVKHSQAGTARSAKLLGFQPVVDFKEGLSRTIDYYREYEDHTDRVL